MIATKTDVDAPRKGVPARYVACVAANLLTGAAFIATAYYLKRQNADAAVITAAASIYGALIVVIASVTARYARKAGSFSPSAATRRYRGRFMIATAAYCVALIGAISADIQHHLIGPTAYALAIAPALPLLAVIVIIGLYLREETDEFLRAVMAEAALWASGGLLAMATVWGFLEQFDLAPHIQIWWAFPIWSVLLGGGQVIARRRYR